MIATFTDWLIKWDSFVAFIQLFESGTLPGRTSDYTSDGGGPTVLPQVSCSIPTEWMGIWASLTKILACSRCYKITTIKSTS